jgi:hypothetical protein
VKTVDPTSRIGIGGLVQPTPLRFAYLDRVWETYRQAFGEEMPVDVWSMHSFILRETTTQPNPDPCGGEDILWDWGADVPPGSDADHGELYCVRDQDNLDIYWDRIRDLRQWMADHGQREKPLYVTEYGVLFPEDYYDEDNQQLDQARVGRFMTGTFDLMLNGTDASIGYPQDGNRLVQKWAWFSLDASPFLWGGTLFDPDTYEIRPLGETFRDYTAAISPQADLLVAKAHTSSPFYLMDSVAVTASLRAEISNIGNISTTLPVEVTFFDGPPGEPGSQVIDAVPLEGGLQGCADYAVVEVDWPDLDVGVHRFFVTVSEIDGEPVENNQAEGVVVVLTHVVYLPFTFGPRQLQ